MSITSDTVLVEQTLKKRHHVQYISTSIHDTNYFMCVNIENRFDNARATIYYQWNGISPILTTILLGLINLKPFPYISQCDKAIKVQSSTYGDNQFKLEYTFTEQSYDSQQIIAVDILDNKHHWHSRSWDQSLENHHTLRKNKFLSSSSLLFSSSPKLNPTRVMSSYPDKQQHIVPWNDDDEEDEITSKSLKDELRIEVNDVPELIISLPDNSEWSNKFAQLCVRCYKRPSNNNKSGYVIQILHPYKLMQYFHQDIGQEETMKLDDEEIQVRLVLKPSPNQRFIVNDNEWPIRSWNLSAHEDTSCSASDEEDDIFVDGMENIDSAVVEPIITPPTKLQLTPQNSSKEFTQLLVEPPVIQNEEPLKQIAPKKMT